MAGLFPWVPKNLFLIALYKPLQTIPMHTLDESVRRDNGILEECEITEQKKQSNTMSNKMV